jgi:hypothetical protein
VAALAMTLLGLASCATPSSTDQAPTGPKPALTVLFRVRSDAGSQVQLLATGVDQPTLNLAAGSVARAVFPDAQPGVPQTVATGVPGETSATVPMVLASDPLTFTVTSAQMEVALQPIVPRSYAVWTCTDSRRTVDVTAEAPGAVSSDISSGSCKIVGSSIKNDGITWSATVALGAVQPPSLLPVAIATSAVLVLLTLVVAYLRGRAATRDPDVPAAPTEPSVH